MNFETKFTFFIMNYVTSLAIKSGTNLHAKSLGTYIKRYAPTLALRLSLNGPKTSGVLHDLPLYAISAVPTLLHHQ